MTLSLYQICITIIWVSPNGHNVVKKQINLTHEHH